jgi:hypothetical protein
MRAFEYSDNEASEDGSKTVLQLLPVHNLMKTTHRIQRNSRMKKPGSNAGYSRRNQNPLSGLLKSQQMQLKDICDALGANTT